MGKKSRRKSDKLRIVFHKIVNSPTEINDEFSIVTNDFENILEHLAGRSFASLNIEIFFDDGHISVLNAKKIFDKYSFVYKLSIVTDWVDASKDHLSSKDLRNMARSGISICSHGCSHGALTVPEKLRNTNNTYQNISRGILCSPSDNEILYQLKESKNKLYRILKEEVKEFVYPFGLYSEHISNIISKNNLYTRAYGCDYQINILSEECQLSLPRLLYTNKINLSGYMNLFNSYIS